MHLNDLFEAVRPALLYHCTPAAEEILRSNEILAKTPHSVRLPYGRTRPGFRPAETDKFNNVYGVSLTRNPFFARRWGSGEGIVLVLDAAKLNRDYRLVAIDHYNGITQRSESEEFLVGPLKNVKKYLVSIQMSQQTYDEMNEYNDQFIEGHKPYELVLNSPLLRIEGKTWNNMSGKIEKAA